MRADGLTPGTPTWIWSGVVDGRLLVRAYNGVRGRWYRSATEQKAGQIHSGGEVYDVEFSPAPAELSRVDALEIGRRGSPDPDEIRYVTSWRDAVRDAS